MKNKEKNDKINWQPLRELALNTPYTMGYLSLMARRKQLKVKKIGRVWYSTMENIKDFEDTMRDRKEERKRQLQESYREKVKREVLKEIESESELATPLAARLPDGQEDGHLPLTKGRKGLKVFSPSTEGEYPQGEGVASRHGGLKISVSSQDTIFDEVQKELEEVLTEIKEREKKLRQDYLAYRGIHGNDDAEVYGNATLAREKQETEELSEKLILDLGRLLNTANKIHEEEEYEGGSSQRLEPTSGEESSVESQEGVSIPIRGGAKHPLRKSTMGMDLRKAKGFSRIGDGINPDNTIKKSNKDNFLSVPYSTFPFEHQGFKQYGDQVVKPEPTSVTGQNKLLLFIAGLLVFIAAILVVLAVFG